MLVTSVFIKLMVKVVLISEVAYAYASLWISLRVLPLYCEEALNILCGSAFVMGIS